MRSEVMIYRIAGQNDVRQPFGHGRRVKMGTTRDGERQNLDVGKLLTGRKWVVLFKCYEIFFIGICNIFVISVAALLHPLCIIIIIIKPFLCPVAYLESIVGSMSLMQCA